MRIGRAVVSLLVLAVGIALIPGPVAATGDRTIRLQIGQQAFWHGAVVEHEAVPSSAECGEAYSQEDACWDYRIDVAKGDAYRLRVALSAILPELGYVREWPDFTPAATEMIFGIELYAPPDAEHPDGELIDQASTQGPESSFTSAYNVEVYANAPDAGDWRVRVIPTSVRNMAFRMRAKLEGRPPKLPDGYLSPNLRITPPFEINFNTPTATQSPGTDTDGTVSSCMTEEVEDAREENYDPPTLCLRYSMGIENADVGYFVLLGDCQVDVTTCGKVDENGRPVVRLHQQLWTADGKHREEALGSAGYGKFHRTHGHFHYEDVWMSELLLVQEGWTPGDPEPSLTSPKPGRKFDLNSTRELMTDWNRFYQELVPAGKGGWIELAPGWADVYEWNRSGNYVDFPQSSPGVPRAGYYVLRGTADPSDNVIESDDADNASYALIHVFANGDVDLLERGYGTDPWDPTKVSLTTSP